MGLGDVLTLMREERVVERSSEREAEALNAVAMGLMGVIRENGKNRALSTESCICEWLQLNYDLAIQ